MDFLPSFSRRGFLQKLALVHLKQGLMLLQIALFEELLDHFLR
jgi:hypothetical protein